jgi:O-antigen/teichoic acid export membrane protein
MLGAKNYGVYVTVSTFVEWFDFLLLGGLYTVLLREGSKDLDRMHIQLENAAGVRNGLIVFSMTACIMTSFFIAPYELRTKIYIVIFSFHIIYNGLRGFYEVIFQATENMKFLSVLSIVNRILYVGLSVAFLYFGFGLTALFLISLFSNFFTLYLDYRFSRRFIKFNLFARSHFDRAFIKPAIIFSLMGLLNYFSTRVDLLMISLLGTAKDVGIYGVAFRIAEQAMMLRNFTAAAFFPIFIKRFHRGKMQGKRLIRISLIFLAVIFAAAFLASVSVEKLLPTIFGSEFKASAHILSILIFYIAFGWASMPFSMAAQSTHNEKYVLIIRSIMAALNVFLNYVFFLQFGLIGIAYSTLVAFSVGAVLEYLISYRVMKRQGHLV